MARVKVNDVDNYKVKNETNWFKLENDGDVARVQFMYKSIDELDIFNCHTVKINNFSLPVNCLREYDSPLDDCPLCKAGIRSGLVMVLCMYDLDDKSVKIWKRGLKFKKQLDGLFNRCGDLTKKVIEIERNGAKGDLQTTYNLFVVDDTPEDISDIEKPDISNVIIDKSFSDMNYYVDKGEFPSDFNNDDKQPAPTSRRSRRRV